MELCVRPLESPPADERPVEVVERKGLGHPDSICDALAEELSLAYSRHCLARFGAIPHHNVDKALLRAGRSAPRFGGGEVLEPMQILLAGRATTRVGAEAVPIEELALDSCRRWLEANLRGLDAERHVALRCVNGLITPGRPMTLESVAGKNPITHVGKLYNLCASLLAQALVDEIEGVREAECVLVSRIGNPIDDPQLAELRQRCDAPQGARPWLQAAELAREHLRGLPSLWRELLEGRVALDRWPLRS